MEIREYAGYDEPAVLELYESVGWTNYTQRPDRLRAAFAGSLLVLGAFEQEQLLGVIRAVGDGASILYIQDLLVRPEWQRQGIGTRLLQAALERYPQVYQLSLMTDDSPETAAFYRACGLFPADEMGCRGFLKVTV